jgi:hypothetical protein
MRQVLIVLERRVAGDVAVLIPRVNYMPKLLTSPLRAARVEAMMEAISAII